MHSKYMHLVCIWSVCCVHTVCTLSVYSVYKVCLSIPPGAFVLANSMFNVCMHQPRAGADGQRPLHPPSPFFEGTSAEFDTTLEDCWYGRVVLLSRVRVKLDKKDRDGRSVRMDIDTAMIECLYDFAPGRCACARCAVGMPNKVCSLHFFSIVCAHSVH